MKDGITEDGKYVMECQSRYGLGKACYEITAGVIKWSGTP